MRYDKNFSVASLLAGIVLLSCGIAFSAPSSETASDSESLSGKVNEALEDASGKASVILDEFRDNIRSNWKKLSNRCADLIGLHDEMPNLPKKAWIKKDQRDQQERIREQLRRIRSLLLSTDAQRILADVEAADAKIAKVKVEIGETWDEVFRNPDKEAKLNAKIAKLEAKRDALELRRAEAARGVIAELDAIGLRLSGDAAEKCIFTVNVGDLIDAAIVAKHVGLVVESLGERMKVQGADVVSARRYYGMYVAMLEVQQSCFNEYLSKSRNGPWRRRLESIFNEATNQRNAALRFAADTSFDLSQREAFQKNAQLFELTQEAVEAYKNILDRHEAVIASKAQDAARMLTVARSSLATVTLAGDFLSLVQTAEDSFDALLQLELPPLELFDDAALQAEIAALTDKLK